LPGTCQLEGAASATALWSLSGDGYELPSVGLFCLRILRVRENLMGQFVAVAVEDPDVTVRLIRIGCDHHDLPIKVVQVMN